MTERAARLVEHIFRVAKPGRELYSVMTSGPETEDTTSWKLTESGDVHVSTDIVYPAMARVAGPERTIPLQEGKQEVLAAIVSEDSDGTLVPHLERKWDLGWPFRILNVFCVDHDRLSGNALCVFEDARGLTDADMQRIARQMNLSETTFLFPSPAGATRCVRIFTPTLEMPFAGHPTLGSAHVVRALDSCGNTLTLEMKVGVVDVRARGNTWTLTAAQAPRTRRAAPRTALARMLQISKAAVVDEPLWIDTGAEQLVVPLRSAKDLARVSPDAALLAEHGASAIGGESAVYVWAPDGYRHVVARFFFLSHGSVVEDPATGSACANLGGWHIATKQKLPLDLEVSQGAHVGRPSRLKLRVDELGVISVSGDVVEVARGTMAL